MICPFCKTQVEELSRHYAGDNCPAIMEALGPVTEAGRQREAGWGSVGAKRPPYQKMATPALAAARAKTLHAQRQARYALRHSPQADMGDVTP